ncbi:hypothetical protein C8R44DRAFT_752920 [Mycena epipterygia]|nr:hypothetical protein C8R44DRAFT_752920 [Mycena epipterygia]
MRPKQRVHSVETDRAGHQNRHSIKEWKETENRLTDEIVRETTWSSNAYSQVCRKKGISARRQSMHIDSGRLKYDTRRGTVQRAPHDTQNGRVGSCTWYAQNAACVSKDRISHIESPCAAGSPAKNKLAQAECQASGPSVEGGGIHRKTQSGKLCRILQYLPAETGQKFVYSQIVNRPVQESHTEDKQPRRLRAKAQKATEDGGSTKERERSYIVGAESEMR